MLPSGKPLAGRVVLVTGGARRIGRALVAALAGAGAAVAFSYRSSAAEARALERELAAAGARVRAFAADLDSPAAPRALLDAVAAEFGGLDVLVNNAGRYETAEFESITDAQWNAMLDSNLTAAFRMCREAVPLLRARRGKIVNLSSIGARRAFPTHAHYCASKAGLDHLTRALARALAPEIQVNGVAPGLIAFDARLTPWEAKMRDRTPLQRAGSGGDVAQAVVYLAAANPFLTGHTLAVDGGLSLM